MVSTCSICTVSFRSVSSHPIVSLPIPSVRFPFPLVLPASQSYFMLFRFILFLSYPSNPFHMAAQDVVPKEYPLTQLLLHHPSQVLTTRPTQLMKPYIILYPLMHDTQRLINLPGTEFLSSQILRRAGRWKKLINYSYFRSTTVTFLILKNSSNSTYKM